MMRACETAGVLMEKYSIGVGPEQRFQREESVWHPHGNNKKRSKAEYPELVEKLKDRLNTIEGAESYEDFRDRVTEAFDRIIELCPIFKYKCVAVIWHGGPMRVLFRDILKKGELKEIGDCAWVEMEKKTINLWSRIREESNSFLIVM